MVRRPAQLEIDGYNMLMELLVVGATQLYNAA